MEELKIEISLLVGKLRRNHLLDLMYDMEGMPFVFCEFNTKTFKFLSMSASCLKAWGYYPEEMINQDYRKYCNEAYIEASDATVEKNITTDAFIDSFENQFIHKDGSLINNRWSGSKPVNDVCFCICIYSKEKK